MRALFLLGILLLGAISQGQEVRRGRRFKLFEPESLDSFAQKQGIKDLPMFTKKVQRPGTIVLAAFGGDQLSVAVVRTKGVDPPADLVAAKAVAKILGDDQIDFNVKETSYASIAELDFSHRISRHGMKMEGSVPLGQVVAELGQWKDLPKPIYVIVAARDGGVSGLNGTIGKAFRIVKPEEVKPEDVADFELHFGFLSYLGVLILLGAGWIVVRTPVRAIKKQLRRPRKVKTAQTFDDLVEQRRYDAYFFFEMVPGLLCLALLAPLYLAFDPSPPRLGLLMIAGRGYFPLAVLYLLVPWILAGFIAPKVIEYRKNQPRPGEDETLHDRVERQKLARNFIFAGVAIALAGAGIAIFVLSRRFPSYFTWVPVELRRYMTFAPLLVGGAMWMIYKFMAKAKGAEPLPHGHPLLDGVQDIGRDAGVGIDHVGVFPSADFEVNTYFGGRVNLSEPVVNLLSPGEALALAAYRIHQKRLRLFDAAQPAAMTATVLVLFATLPNGGGRALIFFVAFGAAGIAVSLIKKWMKPTLQRWDNEALEFAVQHTRQPNDVLLGLARASAIGWGEQAGKFEVIRAKARELGLPVIEENPHEVIAKQRWEEKHGVEDEESPAEAGLSGETERDQRL